MAVATSPQEIVCDAADLMERRGWIQKSEHTSLGFCAVGALKEACRLRRPGHLTVEKELLLDLGTLYFARAIKPSIFGTTGTVISYNDTTGRTKAEVVGMAKKAGQCP